MFQLYNSLNATNESTYLREHAALGVHCRRTAGARKIYARRPAMLSNNRACSDTDPAPKVRPWLRLDAGELPSDLASGRPYTRRIRGVYAIRPDMFSVGRVGYPGPKIYVWTYRVYTRYTSHIRATGSKFQGECVAVSRTPTDWRGVSVRTRAREGCAFQRPPASAPYGKSKHGGGMDRDQAAFSKSS